MANEPIVIIWFRIQGFKGHKRIFLRHPKIGPEKVISPNSTASQAATFCDVPACTEEELLLNADPARNV